MHAFENFCHSAYTIALSAVDKSKRFPENIFLQNWENYFFFESDLIFDDIFIGFKNLILTEEGASVVALINLGNIVFDHSMGGVLFLDKEIGAKESLLSKINPFWTKGIDFMRGGAVRTGVSEEEPPSVGSGGGMVSKSGEGEHWLRSG